MTNKRMISGDKIVALMSKSKATISATAKRMNLTQDRVREVREFGISSKVNAAMEWYQGITGSMDVEFWAWIAEATRPTQQ